MEVARDRLLVAGEAWRAIRAGRQDPTRFGLLLPPLVGRRFIAGKVRLSVGGGEREVSGKREIGLLEHGGDLDLAQRDGCTPGHGPRCSRFRRKLSSSRSGELVAARGTDELAGSPVLIALVRVVLDRDVADYGRDIVYGAVVLGIAQLYPYGECEEA